MTRNRDFEREKLVRQPGWDRPIVLFFYDMLQDGGRGLDNAKPSRNTWLPYSKYMLASGYFWLRYFYLRLLGWLTRYYPFSLLCQDRLGHAKNRPVWQLIGKIEEAAESVGLPLDVSSGQNHGQYIEFIGHIAGQVRGKAELMKKTEAALAEQSITAFLRNDGNRLKVIVSSEAVDAL